MQVNILQRERATQELLLSNARILSQWVNEEIKTLEASTGPHRQQAEHAARELRRAEVRLNEIAEDLVKAQEQRQIERYEVELRSIEVRLYEVLRALHFQPSTGSPTAATATTRAGTHPTTVHVTPRPTTGRPVSTHAPTHAPTHATARPTTARPVTQPPIHTTRAAVTAH